MGAYYFNEFVRIVLGLLPIALILIAMIFLRRQHRTRHTIFLQWLAGVWLAAAAASRLVLSQVVGMGLFPKDGVYSNLANLLSSKLATKRIMKCLVGTEA
jgi:hypothetical protein